MIGEVAVGFTARTEKANRKIREFGRNLRQLTRPANVANAALGRLGASVAAFGAGALTVRRFRQIADDLDRTAKVSSKLGVAAENLRGLRHAAEQTGVSADSLDTSLQRMTRRISEAAQGTGEAQGALRELGLDAEKLNRMAPDQAFSRIADAMGRVKTRGDQLRLTVKLFDSEGAGLVNTLDLGANGLGRMTREADKLGPKLTENLARIERFNDAMDRLSKAFGGVGQRLVIGITPEVERLTDTLQAWFDLIEKRQRQIANFAASSIEQVNRLDRRILKVQEDARGLPLIGSLFPGGASTRERIEQRQSYIDNLRRVGRGQSLDPTPRSSGGSASRSSPGTAPTDFFRSLGDALSRFDRFADQTRRRYLINAPQGRDALGNLTSRRRQESSRFGLPPAIALENLRAVMGAMRGGGTLLAGASNDGRRALDEFFRSPVEQRGSLVARTFGTAETEEAARRNLRGAGVSTVDKTAKNTGDAVSLLKDIRGILRKGGAALNALPIGA